MNKQLKTRILLIASLLVIVVACVEDIGVEKKSATSSKNEQLTTSVARKWFESNYAPIVTTRSNEGRERAIKPYWDRAKESNRKRYEVVETPILSNGWTACRG